MEKFFNAVQNMFKVPELRTRIFFTLGMLAVYRFGAHVTAPGIDKVRLEQVWGEVAGTLLGVLDLFSGGNFRTISVFALGERVTMVRAGAVVAIFGGAALILAG